MDTAPEVTRLSPGPALGIRAEVALADLSRFFGEAFHELVEVAGGEIAGPPFARYHHFGDLIDVEAMVPLRAPVAGKGRVEAVELAGGPAVRVRHLGPYDQLSSTYTAIEHWLEDHHRERAEPVREVYLTSPGEVPDPARWITDVIQPVTEPRPA
jgi:effector-binding domain-containing protein